MLEMSRHALFSTPLLNEVRLSAATSKVAEQAASFALCLVALSVLAVSSSALAAVTAAVAVVTAS